jgi:hypothetical protein
MIRGRMHTTRNQTALRGDSWQKITLAKFQSRGQNAEPWDVADKNRRQMQEHGALPKSRLVLRSRLDEDFCHFVHIAVLGHIQRGIAELRAMIDVCTVLEQQQHHLQVPFACRHH